MRYLIDTCVVSELRKGARCDHRVRNWVASVDPASMFLSVLTLGEMHVGIERLRLRDPQGAHAFDRWIASVEIQFSDRLVPVDRSVVLQWARLSATGPLSPIDGLLAATAFAHGMTLVTRNIKDVARTGVPLVNPFDLE